METNLINDLVNHAVRVGRLEAKQEQFNEDCKKLHTATWQMKINYRLVENWESTNDRNFLDAVELIQTLEEQ